jgi:hypothetical protein
MTRSKVVQGAWTVQAEADQEAVFVKELAPLLIDQRPVRLQRVVDAHAGLAVLLLIGDRLPEEVQPHQRRLAALPGESDLGHALRLDVLARVVLQQVVGHAKAAARIQHLLG